MSTQLIVAAGEDQRSVTEGAMSLLKENGGRWELTKKGNGLERTFQFKTFKKTWVSLDVSRDLLGEG